MFWNSILSHVMTISATTSPDKIPAFCPNYRIRFPARIFSKQLSLLLHAVDTVYLESVTLYIIRHLGINGSHETHYKVA